MKCTRRGGKRSGALSERNSFGIESATLAKVTLTKLMGEHSNEWDTAAGLALACV